MDLIERVRLFVEEECKKPTSHYGYEPFEAHFAFVVKYSQELADKLGADKEVVTLAAWMHDIGSIIHGREDHHITGARIAEEKLRELGYPEEKINKIKICILNHRGSQEENNKRDFIEAKIIAEADSLDAFSSLSKHFLTTLVYEKKQTKEAGISVKTKLQNKWNQLELEESRELIKPKYEAAMLLLE